MMIFGKLYRQLHGETTEEDRRAQWSLGRWVVTVVVIWYASGVLYYLAK